MSARATPLRERSGVRPEIQALRAIAVLAVVIGHVWPRFAPGGFVGVDVFFVISGFLITGQLIRERERTGTIALRSFYLRRARRLLPAAIVVLAVCAVLTLVFVPRGLWEQYLGEIVASLLYVQNWFLAIASLDPTRAVLDASPVVHFWSLSVEEQFYLVWPLLIILCYAAIGVLGRRGPRIAPVFGVVLGAVTIASFVYCVLQTGVSASDVAYYSTFARAWEFGLGGLLAFLPLAHSFLTPRQRGVISWLGVAAIVGAVLAWRDPGAFPGPLAVVPALGAAAVIIAGAPELSWGTIRIARLRFVQWLGDASYSLYLWHWPIIAFLPFITGVPTPWYVLIGVLALCLVVAGLSLRFIENPIRFRTPGFVRARTAILGGLVALAAGTVGASAWGIWAAAAEFG
ncbi:acyltransferase family protein [Amnibacterium flavum]|uniref:Acyltransferase 3 domain-containing protein n=1 Tax=Amnibacterium flavum TaxID=2173173 RepID=A0A2V1HVL6_9MICO|nr:acyltransferase [Amnibacterium flavum]PVZ95129.1 hypothetical protein DDQ50_00935 [Amnibacterium flavum]